MGRLRFSLLGLLAGVTLTAVGLFALLNASPLLVDLTSATAVALLFIAVLGSIYRREATRAFTGDEVCRLCVTPMISRSSRNRNAVPSGSWRRSRV